MTPMTFAPFVLGAIVVHLLVLAKIVMVLNGIEKRLGELEALGRVCGLLGVANETNLRILLALRECDRNVTDLTAEVRSGQPSVSHQLSILRLRGLVRCSRAGKCNVYSITETGRLVADAADALVPKPE